MKYVLSVLIAYIIGSVSFSVVISSLFEGKDVRSSGSGNAGATNMARLFGIVPGLVTLVLDFLKEVLAIYIGSRLAGDPGLCLAAVFCVVGHCFPIFFSFRGGKGASCALAAAFMFSWKIGVCAVLIFLVCAVLSRKVSLSSILGCLVAEIVSIFLPLPADKLVSITVIVILVIVRHSENIRKLLACREKSFRSKKNNRSA